MRKYSKAYYLKDLRKYEGWKEAERSDGEELTDETVVYLQDNYTVVKDVFDEEDYIFSDVDDSWVAFCKEELEFEIPDFGSSAGQEEAAAN